MAYRMDENGNYVRTVRCSNCWESGHNKSKCPREKARYERAKLEDPDSWFVKNYESRKAERSKRACSYCRETGHTRRTCEHFKTDMAGTVAMNKEWRQKALDFFENIGLGIGSLIEVENKSRWGSNSSHNVLVTGFHWENLTFQVSNARHRALKVRTLENFGRETYVGMPSDPAGIVTDFDPDYGIHVKVLGPISRNAVKAAVPAKWLTGAGDEVKKMFLDHNDKPCERYEVNWLEKK